MQKRLKTKLDNYVAGFRQSMVEQIRSGGSEEDLIHFVMEYPGVTIDDKDFLKRKRSNNIVPICERCTAKKMGDIQCTRRKKEGSEYCGTHLKGTRYGLMEPSATSTGMKQKEIYLQAINGIEHYIDDEGNVYCVEDVDLNKYNPRVIGSYTKLESGSFTIQLL